LIKLNLKHLISLASNSVIDLMQKKSGSSIETMVVT
jgi:hypothetical protein